MYYIPWCTIYGMIHWLVDSLIWWQQTTAAGIIFIFLFPSLSLCSCITTSKHHLKRIFSSEVIDNTIFRYFESFTIMIVIDEEEDDDDDEDDVDDDVDDDNDYH